MEEPLVDLAISTKIISGEKSFADIQNSIGVFSLEKLCLESGHHVAEQSRLESGGTSPYLHRDAGLTYYRFETKFNGN